MISNRELATMSSFLGLEIMSVESGLEVLLVFMSSLILVSSEDEVGAGDVSLITGVGAGWLAVLLLF